MISIPMKNPVVPVGAVQTVPVIQQQPALYVQTPIPQVPVATYPQRPHYHRRNGVSRTKVCICVGLITLLVVAAIAGIVIFLTTRDGPDMHDHKGSHKAMHLHSHVRVLSWAYDRELEDKESQMFHMKEKHFCDEVTGIIHSTLGKDALAGCSVNHFRRGANNVQVDFVLTLEPGTGPYDTNFRRTVMEQLICGFSDPYWSGITVEKHSIYFTDWDKTTMFKYYGCQDMDSCTRDGAEYHCKCPPGYEVDPYDDASCRDIDECMDKNGLCEGYCMNMPGSYRCSCPDGQTLKSNGLGCEGPGLEFCTDNKCEYGACIPGVGSYSCHCNEGFKGYYCDEQICDKAAGWEYFRETDHCYKYFGPAGKDQPDAEADCVSNGGHLVSPNDQEEMQFISTLLTNKPHLYAYYNDVQFVWTGLVAPDVDSVFDNGTWTWTDGSDGFGFYILEEGLVFSDDPIPGEPLCGVLLRANGYTAYEYWNEDEDMFDALGFTYCRFGSAADAKLARYVCEKESGE